MATMFGDLQGLRPRQVEDLPTDGVSVTVGGRQPRAQAVGSFPDFCT